LPRLVSIEETKNGSHAGLLSTTDDRLIEVLIAVLTQHGGYRVRIISKAERDPEYTPFLKQFFKE